MDVTLTITPIDPPPGFEAGPPLHLRVLASKDLLPPSIESTQATPEGIVVKFSKPMDPAGASNANNYAVQWLGRARGMGRGGFRGSGGFTTSGIISSYFSSLFLRGHSSDPSPAGPEVRAAQIRTIRLRDPDRDACPQAKDELQGVRVLRVGSDPVLGAGTAGA